MKLKLSDNQKRIIRESIENCRSVGGVAWNDFSREELEEIYGYLPYWAEEIYKKTEKILK